ncbi:DsbA family oxidoreductase [Streptomyces sp. NPDC000609]|uniref:DsbA family oxidoreductase n=1 Tax=Streptomyces sp. NPDC000609 TaxID=3160957 RepID=UPI0033966C03
MRVEVFGDVLCPWCYIGKRRIEAAAGQVTEAGRVQIVWRSHELDPGAGRILGPTAAEALSTWWGEKALERIAQIQTEGRLEGLELNLHAARPVSSFDAHRLIHLATEHDLAGAVVESLLHAYRTEGQNIADPQVLEQLGVKAGLRTVDVRDVLGGEAYALSVRADERRAVALGVTSVPAVAIDGGPPASGIQPSARLRLLLEEALSVSHGRGR